MPYPPTPTEANVAISTPWTSIQLRDSLAMLVVAAIIIKPCADSGRIPSNCPTTTEAQEEVTEAPGEPDHLGTLGPRAKDIAPVSPLTGTHAITSPAVASPAVPPIVPTHSASPISLTILLLTYPFPVLPGQHQDYPSSSSPDQQHRNLDST